MQIGFINTFLYEIANIKKHLIFAGGGHVHFTAFLNINNFAKPGHMVSVISPSGYRYYSGMGPCMFSGIYRPVVKFVF
ncbi:hypothetical protein BMS3Abin07_01223 [bacterium BMS3Abin07]|nr:hypothetical protein BMS3Abin07_01223 [bacterium BMS3Abin07]GBE31546.1 hypothetical protein BMS3Bbin05_00448 [bacterium BMS3Bbin05]